MRTLLVKLLSVAGMLGICGNAFAQTEPTLKVGSPAPKLAQGKYIQGEPVKELAKGKAYLVEFWATWCGPCRVSIPHLNELHNKYKDKGLIVIGQDCWERDEEGVKPFVEKMGDKMTYRVALDDKSVNKDGAMADAWMKAAGRDGIPSAFLVDTNKTIVWIGHPMELKEETIQQVLAGTYDVKKAAAESAQLEKNKEKIAALSQELSQAARSNKWDEALAKLDEIGKLVPPEAQNGVEQARFRLLLDKKDYPAAYKLAKKVTDANKDDKQLLNGFAAQIAMDPKIEKRDLELASQLAQRANDLAGGKEPEYLHTLARIEFLQGHKEKAVELATKTLELAPEELKERLKAVVESYKSGKLPKDDSE